MANIKAIKTGNHNDPTVWDGGVVPTIGDTAFANAFVIEILTDWELDLISNAVDAVSGAVPGGYFKMSNVSPTTLVLDADVVGGTISTACLAFYGSGEKIVNGTVTGGTGNMNCDGARCYSQGPVHITTVYGGPDGNYYNFGFRIDGITGCYVEIGSAYPGKHNGVQIYGGSDGSSIIIDSVYGHDVYGSNGINLHSGNLYAGQATAGFNSYAIETGAAAICEIDEVISGTRVGVYSVDLYGCLTPGVVKQVNMLSTGLYPIRGPHVFSSTDPLSVVSIDESDDPISLVSVTTLAPVWYPVESDVRSDITYANGGLIGTCKVPAPGNVALNVEVDDTVGTALLTNEQLLNSLGVMFAAYFP